MSGAQTAEWTAEDVVAIKRNLTPAITNSMLRIDRCAPALNALYAQAKIMDAIRDISRGD